MVLTFLSKIEISLGLILYKKNEINWIKDSKLRKANKNTNQLTILKNYPWRVILHDIYYYYYYYYYYFQLSTIFIYVKSARTYLELFLYLKSILNNWNQLLGGINNLLNIFIIVFFINRDPIVLIVCTLLFNKIFYSSISGNIFLA